MWFCFLRNHVILHTFVTQLQNLNKVWHKPFLHNPYKTKCKFLCVELNKKKFKTITKLFGLLCLIFCCKLLIQNSFVQTACYLSNTNMFELGDLHVFNFLPRPITDPAYEDINNAFERSLVFIHKVLTSAWIMSMPLYQRQVAIQYCEVVENSFNVESTVMSM